MTDEEVAQIVLNCMDLTSLSNSDSIYKIEKLIKDADTPYGRVASLCVYQKFIPLIKKKSDINIATVVNFPHATDSIEQIKADITSAVNAGANEVDIVFPYKDYLDKNLQRVEEFLTMVHSLNKSVVSKIILETFELKKLTTIVDVTKLCLEVGAGFIKTSTGKVGGGATPEVANIILETISSYPKKAGFKASGGIKTLEDARKYVVLAQSIMGEKWLNPSNFRIGASSLLTEVLQCLSKI